MLTLTLHTRGGDNQRHCDSASWRTPRLLASSTASISRSPLHGTAGRVRNHDVPGVIGRIGTILGEHQVNIANFALGRGRTGGQRR